MLRLLSGVESHGKVLHSTGYCIAGANMVTILVDSDHQESGGVGGGGECLASSRP